MFGFVSMATATSIPVRERAWKPLVTLAANGDSALALARLNQQVSLLSAALHNLYLDEPTQRITDEFWKAWEHFDLEGLYELLPEKKGQTRQVRVQGARTKSGYALTKPKDESFRVTPRGTRTNLGDLSAIMQAQPVAADDGEVNYLIGVHVGASLGPIEWSGIEGAGAESLRFVGSGDPHASEYPSSEKARGSRAARERVARMNHSLGAEDVEVLSAIWTAFPATSALIEEVGRVDDVLTVTMGEDRYQHVSLRYRIRPEQLEKMHPHVAEHADDLGRLLDMKLDLTDARGLLAHVHVDTKTLMLSMELYVRDGEVLPFRAGQVRLSEAWPEGKPHPMRMRIDARFHALGIDARMRDLRVHLVQRSTGDGMRLSGRVVEVPRIVIEGSALGFVPVGLIDAFIPGSMEQLVQHFLTVACKGNDHQGITFGLNLQPSSSGSAMIADADFALEGVDNALVKLGVGVVNDKIMLNEDATRDSRKFMSRVVTAFQSDLNARANSLTN